MFTPMSKRLLGFTSMENAVTYVAIGVIAVAGYFRFYYNVVALTNTSLQYKIRQQIFQRSNTALLWFGRRVSKYSSSMKVL